MTDTIGNDGTGGAQPLSERVLRDFAPYPYQSLDEEGTVLTVNNTWLETLGYEREAVEGDWFGELLTDDPEGAVFVVELPTVR